MMKALFIIVLATVAATATPMRERRSLGWGHDGAVIVGGLGHGLLASHLAPATAVIGPSAPSVAVLGPNAGSAAVLGPVPKTAVVAGPSGAIIAPGVSGHGVLLPGLLGHGLW